MNWAWIKLIPWVKVADVAASLWSNKKAKDAAAAVDEKLKDVPRG